MGEGVTKTEMGVMSTSNPQDPASDPHGIVRDADNPATLMVVYAAVIALALATIGLSSLGLGKFALPLQLLIASVQAGLVAYHFMHLKHGDRVVILTALSSLFWMGILFVLFMADYMSRHALISP